MVVTFAAQIQNLRNFKRSKIILNNSFVESGRHCWLNVCCVSMDCSFDFSFPGVLLPLVFV